MPASEPHRSVSHGRVADGAVEWEVPDLFSPVFGFRDWRVTDDGLCSPRTGTVWSERTLAAECRPRNTDDFIRPPHHAPDPDCHCGIHAYHRFGDEASKFDFRGVTGVVSMWGNVEVHASGMRGELARVEALGVYDDWTRRQKLAVLDVAESLGVDLVDLRDLQAYADSRADAVPSTLIPGGHPQPRAFAPERPGMPGHHVLVGTGA